MEQNHSTHSRSLLLLQELKWSLSPQTPVSWLNVYMQVAYLKETDELLLPRYPQETFTQIAQVPSLSVTHVWLNCSLCLLDGVQPLTKREDPLVPLIEVTWV